MARRHRHPRQPIHLRHKLLGSLLTLLGLASMAACGLLTGYLVNHLLAGETLALVSLIALAFVLGAMFLFMAWHQFVVAPKQDHLQETFQRYRRIQRQSHSADEE